MRIIINYDQLYLRYSDTQISAIPFPFHLFSRFIRQLDRIFWIMDRGVLLSSFFFFFSFFLIWFELNFCGMFAGNDFAAKLIAEELKACAHSQIKTDQRLWRIDYQTIQLEIGTTKTTLKLIRMGWITCKIVPSFIWFWLFVSGGLVTASVLVCIMRHRTLENEQSFGFCSMSDRANWNHIRVL